MSKYFIGKRLITDAVLKSQHSNLDKGIIIAFFCSCFIFPCSQNLVVLPVTLAGVSLLEGSQEFLQKQVPLGQLAWFQILAVG